MNSTFAERILTPLAIIIAGALIALALYNRNVEPLISETGSTVSDPSPNAFLEPSPEYDHIRGSVDAPVTIVEWSDFQCPFCSDFHPILKKLIEDRGDEVRWVYRDFPLTNIHPEALPSAIASGCVALLAGNDAYWEFADFLFENQSILSSQLYLQKAIDLGITEGELAACVEREDIASGIADEQSEAITLGATGTPFSIVVTPRKELIPFTGALSREQLDQVIDYALGRGE